MQQGAIYSRHWVVLDGTCSKVTGVCDEVEGFSMIRKGKDRGCGESMDQ